MDAVKEAVLEQKIDNLTERFDQVDARFAQVDARFEQVDARFAQVDARFDRLEDRFEQAEERNRIEFRAIRSEMNEGFGELRTEMASLNRTLIIIFGSALGTAVAALFVAAVGRLF